MDLFSKYLKTVPKKFQEEYISNLKRVFCNRALIFSLTITGLFLFAYFSAYFLSPVDLVHSEFIMILVLGIFLALSFWGSRNAKTLGEARRNAFFAIVFFMVFIVGSTLKRPESFNYAPFILILFFTTLMMPWFVRDIWIIICIHFFGFYAYCVTRDFSKIIIPETIFGSDPFYTGAAFIGFAGILCLVVRFKENQIDIYNFLLLKEVEEKKVQMEQDLEFAAKVHGSLVPKPIETDKVDICVTYKPMTAIGGDYANFHFVKDDKLIFFIGDVTGHGVPAALLVNRLHIEFERLSVIEDSPGVILGELNKFIIRAFSGTSLFLTAFCGVIDFNNSKVSYSNYGHLTQYLYDNKEQRLVGMKSHTTLLGIDLGEEKTYESMLDYRAGTEVFLFTDGILELKNAQKEEYGSARLESFIQNNIGHSHECFHEKLMEDLGLFGEGDFNDDVFLVTLKLK